MDTFMEVRSKTMKGAYLFFIKIMCLVLSLATKLYAWPIMKNLLFFYDAYFTHQLSFNHVFLNL